MSLVTTGAMVSGNYSFAVTATDPGGNSRTEIFTLSVGTSGTDGQGLFTITSGTDISLGLNGGDTIRGGDGDDALVGGQGGDLITGGAGADQIIGGQGGDRFIFTSTTDSTKLASDTIFDFEASLNNETIDLSGIDANLQTGSDQSFTFVAVQTSSVAAYSVTWYQDKDRGSTVVQADNNGDGVADVVITLHGLHSLERGDFIL